MNRGFKRMYIEPHWTPPEGVDRFQPLNFDGDRILAAERERIRRAVADKRAQLELERALREPWEEL